MGDPEFGHQTERRRKRVTRIVVAALVLTVVVIAVAYRWKSAPSEKHLAVPQALPANVNQQLSGYSFTRSDNGQRIFTVHAARTVAFKEGGETVLNDVWVEVFGRLGDRHDLLRTRSCTFNRQTGELFAEQKVEIELNAPAEAFPEGAAAEPRSNPSLESAEQPAEGSNGRLPIYLETSQLSFVRNGALLTTDAPVQFRVGLASGTAEGLTYATRDEWLELKKNVVINMQPGSGDKSSVPARLEAARLRFEKSTGVVTLTGPVQATQQDRRAWAGSGRIFLDGRNRIGEAELEGGVRASVPSPQSLLQGSAQRVHAAFEPKTSRLRSLTAQGGVQGELKDGGKIIHLAAQQFRMNFSRTPLRPRDGSASGDVRLVAQAAENVSAGAPRQSGAGGGLAETNQELTASAVQFAFAPGGRRLKEAATVGGGKLVLTPRDPKVGKRVITSEPLVMAFDALGRLAALHGLSNSRIVFLPPPTARPGSPAAESTSDRLEASFDPSNQTLRAADQIGDFRLRQGDWQASAERARYEASNEIVTLSGHPRVRDDQTRAQADRVLLDMRADTAEGLGHVQATHLESGGKAPTAGRGDPTNVVADRMFARRQSQFVHYEGKVRVWHGKDVVESSSIDVFKAERRVRSGSQVLTSFLQPASEAPSDGPKPAGAQDKTAPVTIRADGLEYFDEGRKASYRGNVRLETENTSLRSDRLDVFFSSNGPPGASEVERAVAEGHVTVIQPSRRATGEHAEYHAAPGKILVTGGPPMLYDAEKGFTTGQRLTLFLRDDRIFLDGGEESPTLSRHRIPQ